MDRTTFLTIVSHTPLVSIDLVLQDPDGRLLMGRRVNEPARGSWFVPGGRIRKDESLEAAFARIADMELGCELSWSNARLMGAYTHRYATNFAQVEGIGTHYVCLAYHLCRALPTDTLPVDQHTDYRWIGAADDLTDVHENCQVYLRELAGGER